MIALLEALKSIVDPFTVLLALLPLISYLLVLSLIRLSGNVLVTTGGRDIAALAVAIAGMLAVGPAELFFPTTAATVFGPIVWIAIAAFYGLTVALIALTSRPKLVVYGRTPEELHEPLLAAAKTIDTASVGDIRSLQVQLPSLGIRLRLDGQRGIDHAQVLAFEPNVSLQFWSQLLRALRGQLRSHPAPIPHRGFGMLLAVALLSSILIWQSFSNRELVVEGFRNWLWR